MKKIILVAAFIGFMGCGEKNPDLLKGTIAEPIPLDSGSYFYQNNVKVLAFLKKEANTNFLLATDFKSTSEYNILQIGISPIPTAAKSFVIRFSSDSINTRNVYMAFQKTKNGVNTSYTAMSGNGDLLRFEIDEKGRKVFKFNPFVCQNLSGSMYDTVRISGKLILLE